MKKSKERRLKEKLVERRQVLVNAYNRALNEHGKSHIKTKYCQKKLQEFDNANQ